MNQNSSSQEQTRAVRSFQLSSVKAFELSPEVVISGLFMSHHTKPTAADLLFGVLHVVYTCTGAAACAGLVSLGFTFLSGLNPNHLQSRSSSETAKRRQVELAAIAPPKVRTAFIEEVVVLVTSVCCQEVETKTVGLFSGAEGDVIKTSTIQDF